MSWDDLFINIVYLVALKSHDPRTKIGAVITSKENMILSIGYNGLPRGISYDEKIMNSSAKYDVICHGEENAILNSSRLGITLIDAKIYVNLLPCHNCARAIIQSGIREVVVHQQGQDAHQKSSRKDDNHWKKSFELTHSLFYEAGVSLRFVDNQLVTPKGFFNGGYIDAGN